MPAIRSTVFTAVVCFWSTAAAAISLATPEQMVCQPAVFVVATVTEDSPFVSVPERCKNAYCVSERLLTIKVDRVLASRTPEATSRFKSGNILQIKVQASRFTEWLATEPRWKPDSFGNDSKSANALQQTQFIFGIFDGADLLSQVWRMAFQGQLETALTEAADPRREDHRQCPKLLR